MHEPDREGFGDVLQAAIIYTGTALGFVLSSFAALNLAFTVVWFLIAAALAREYKKRSVGPIHPKRVIDISEAGRALSPARALESN